MCKKYYCMFVGIIILQIIVFSFVFNLKPDLFMDEYWTLNFANSYYNPLVGRHPELFNTWLSFDYWQRLLSVQQGEQFSYNSVVYNTARDVHPPFYYILIHTIYSFFPDCFNPWLGFAPNVFLFIGTQCIMVILARELGMDKFQSLLPCIIYGFSIGAIATVSLIRMYMLLTFISTLSIYLHVRLLKKQTYILLFALAIVHISGFLTQYYYLLFATAEYLVVAYLKLKEKCYKELALFTLLNCVALSITVAAFPTCLEHIMGNGENSYRGNEILNNLDSYNFLGNFIVYLKLLVRSEIALCYMVFIIIAVILCSRFNNKPLGLAQGIYNKIICLYLASVTITFIIIVKISQTLFLRYLYMLFPICIVGIYYVYSKVLVDTFCIKKRIVTLSICCITLLQICFIKALGIETLLEVGNNNLPKITKEWIEKEQIKQNITITFSEDYGFVIYNFGLLRQMPASYIIHEGNLSSLANLELDNKVIINYDPRNKTSIDQFVNYCERMLGYKTVARYQIHSRWGWNCVLEKIEKY